MHDTRSVKPLACELAPVALIGILLPQSLQIYTVFVVVACGTSVQLQVQDGYLCARQTVS